MRVSEVGWEGGEKVGKEGAGDGWRVSSILVTNHAVWVLCDSWLRAAMVRGWHSSDAQDARDAMHVRCTPHQGFHRKTFISHFYPLLLSLDH